ncbi:MAG: TssQ family T6SS-associated lipoprotein [Betaproteobacteria bacterium]|nr:TssQ family T6SS-associated lipoprotein [Betaproteobacteria bacterium]
MSRALAVSALLTLGGCALMPMRGTGGPSPSRQAEQALALGVHDYENGHYKRSAHSLSRALALGLPSKKEQITAHKYLAFIDCTSNHQGECRKEFEKALAIDPNFELSTAEAGHPIWGPIFSSVKARLPAAKR